MKRLQFAALVVAGVIAMPVFAQDHGPVEVSSARATRRSCPHCATPYYSRMAMRAGTSASNTCWRYPSFRRARLTVRYKAPRRAVRRRRLSRTPSTAWATPSADHRERFRSIARHPTSSVPWARPNTCRSSTPVWPCSTKQRKTPFTARCRPTRCGPDSVVRAKPMTTATPWWFTTRPPIAGSSRNLPSRRRHISNASPYRRPATRLAHWYR